MARTIGSIEKLERRKDDMLEEGWKVAEDTGDRVVFQKNDFGSFAGHALVFLLTAWWTLGIGNVLYAAKRYFMNSSNRVYRVEQ